MFLLSAKFGTGQFKMVHCLLSKVTNCRRNSNWSARNEEMGLSYVRLNRRFIVGEAMLKVVLLAKGRAGVHGSVGVSSISDTRVPETGEVRTGVVGSNIASEEESWVSFRLSLPLANVVAGCVGVAEASVAKVVEPVDTAVAESADAAVANSVVVVVGVGIGISGGLGLRLGLPLADPVAGAVGGISDHSGGQGSVDTVAE